MLSMILASGCIKSQNSDATPGGQERPELLLLQGFAAEYRDAESGKSIQLSMDGPVSIRDSRGVSRDAYRLVDAYPDFQLIQYIDSSFRIVREDTTCFSDSLGPPGCHRYWVSWTALNLPSHGYGWPLLSSADLARRNLSGHATAGGYEVTADGYVYRYGSSLILPESMRGGEANYVLSRLEPGAPAVPIDPWPDEPVPTKTRRQGDLFPGDDQLYPGHKVTPRQMFEALRQEPVIASEIEAGGCVQRTMMHQSGGTAWDSPLGRQALFNRSTAKFRVVYENGTAREWSVTYREDALPTESFAVTPGTWAPGSWDCAALLDSPWPILSMERAYEIAEQVSIRKSNRFPPHIMHSLSSDSLDGSRDRYSVMYLPWWHESGASYFYEVGFNANTGAYDHVVFHPDDQTAFDG